MARVVRGFLVVMGLAVSACVPSNKLGIGDDFPDLKVINGSPFGVSWQSDYNENWFGDLAPGGSLTLHPSSADSVVTIEFTLPSGSIVEMSGTVEIKLEQCE